MGLEIHAGQPDGVTRHPRVGRAMRKTLLLVLASAVTPTLAVSGSCANGADEAPPSWQTMATLGMVKRQATNSSARRSGSTTCIVELDAEELSALNASSAAEVDATVDGSAKFGHVRAHGARARTYHGERTTPQTRR